ncbi:MAG TPA: GNAT family N-acetyltransferase [Candidatus Nitrosotenuis sp.]|nr:GNAT family N-acetyltransferase [Candidatus Nitrosotenuis sp.]
MHAKLRKFCLEQIKLEYGFVYRSDWHSDLDSLLDLNGIYSAVQKGDFVHECHTGAEIYAVGGLRDLQTHATSWERFHDRYKKPCALWRVYVQRQDQGKGAGKRIVEKLESRAQQLGYDEIYLHTSWKNPGAVKFWQKMGYTIFCEDKDAETTVHMEKRLT